MDEALYKQLIRWHEEEEFQKIVDAVLALPDDERDYESTGQLARALNNLGDYETAAEFLLGVEEQGDNDPLWHYRLGYAYFNSRMFKQAKEEFGKVLQLTPDDDDAQMYVEWCEEELSPTAKTDRLNDRLMATEALTAGITFRERVDAFWQWFTQREALLAEMVEKREEEEADKMIEMVAEGVRLLGEDVNFNIGGNYEFTFAVEGQVYLFYLLPWLVARMPEQFRGKWNFLPYMQGTQGESLGFEMYGRNIPLEEVKVGLHYVEEQNYFDVRFYHAALVDLPENESYNAFYIMMELTIGEGLARIYVNRVEQAAGMEKGMFPLTKLEACMTMALEEAKKNILLRPDERYTVYEMALEEGMDLRYDTVVGNTCFAELVREYFSGEAVNADKLENCGAKAAFLVVPVENSEPSESLRLRYEIEDCLIARVLGERGSGRETGMVLGGACGKDYLYVDLLLYDTPAFIFAAQVVLMDFPYPFYLAEFRPESRLVALAGVDGDIPVIPERPSEMACRMMEYADCPSDWFAPTADAHPLDAAYFVAVEAGREGGYVPVLLKIDDALEDFCQTEGMLDMNKVREERRCLLEETELPDGQEYLDRLIAGRQLSAENAELKEGTPNTELSAYWNYYTRLTEELLLIRIPVEEPWKILGWFPFRYGEGRPERAELLAIAKHWYEAYGAIPAVVGVDEVEFYVARPVEDERQALQLAKEQCAFCPAVTEQGKNTTLGMLAQALLHSTVWYFWWD